MSITKASVHVHSCRGMRREISLRIDGDDDVSFKVDFRADQLLQVPGYGDVSCKVDPQAG